MMIVGTEGSATDPVRAVRSDLDSKVRRIAANLIRSRS